MFANGEAEGAASLGFSFLGFFVSRLPLAMICLHCKPHWTLGAEQGQPVTALLVRRGKQGDDGSPELMRLNSDQLVLRHLEHSREAFKP